MLFRGAWTAPASAAGGVFLAALVLYVVTAAPTVTLVDSGELILAARTLGVAHPPGFPLYVLLAHVATLVPAGSVAQRVNLASSLFGALGAATLTLLVWNLLSTRPVSRARPRQGRRKDGPVRRAGVRSGDGSIRTWPTVAAALFAGLLFTVTRTPWSYATIAEVYALNTWMLGLVLLLAVVWRNGHLRGRDGLPQDLLLGATALFAGLGLGVHLVTTGLALPGVAVLCAGTAGIGHFLKPRRLAWLAGGLAAGLLVYAALPLAAWRDPLLNWGDPSTLGNLWWHVTGRQYRAYLSFAPADLAGQIGQFAAILFREHGFPWIPAGLLLAFPGVIDLFRRDRWIVPAGAVICLSDVAYAATYDIAEDQDAYYLPVFLCLGVAAGAGAARLIGSAFPSDSRRRRPLARAGLVLLLAPALAVAGNRARCDRSGETIARDHVGNVLSTIEPGGMLLTSDWQVYSPLLYLSVIENVRPDVTAIDVNLLRRSWYFRTLGHLYPALMHASRAEVDAFLRGLREWENDPDAFARDAARARRLTELFHRMILAFLIRHDGPVHITLDLATPSSADPELQRLISSTYQLIPHGLVFRLVEDRVFRTPPRPALDLDWIADARARFEPDDVVAVKILPVYRDMFTNRGRYLAAHGFHPEAAEAYREALSIDPEFGFAKRSLAESLEAHERSRRAPPASPAPMR